MFWLTRVICPCSFSESFWCFPPHYWRGVAGWVGFWFILGSVMGFCVGCFFGLVSLFWVCFFFFFFGFCGGWFRVGRFCGCGGVCLFFLGGCSLWGAQLFSFFSAHFLMPGRMRFEFLPVGPHVLFLDPAACFRSPLFVPARMIPFTPAWRMALFMSSPVVYDSFFTPSQKKEAKSLLCSPLGCSTAVPSLGSLWRLPVCVGKVCTTIGWF